jgi:hypothetical protein
MVHVSILLFHLDVLVALAGCPWKNFHTFSKYVPVINSVDVDYSRNRIMLDDDFLA